MHVAWCILLGAVMVFPAQAQQNISATVGLTVLDFDYREYDQQGTQIDRETGILPGVGVGLQFHRGGLMVEADIAGYGNDVSYDGHTQRGRTLQTRTDELIISGVTRTAYTFAHTQHMHFAIKGMLGLRYWQRNIRSTPEARGLLEVYRWPYVAAGLDIAHRTIGDTSIGIEVAFIKAFASQLTVDFDGRYDRTTMPLTDGDGFTINLPLAITLGDALLTVSAHAELWRFPRSPDHLVTRDGQFSGAIVTEPESQTATYGLTLALTRR